MMHIDCLHGIVSSMLLILSAVRNMLLLAIALCIHLCSHLCLLAPTKKLPSIVSPRKAESWERSVSKQGIVLIIISEHEAMSSSANLLMLQFTSHSFSLTLSRSESSPQM